MHLKMSSETWWPFCLGLNVLMNKYQTKGIGNRQWADNHARVIRWLVVHVQFWTCTKLPNRYNRHHQTSAHDDVIKWKHLLHYWPFVQGIHRPSVNSPHKGQWRGALMFSSIYAWINPRVNNGEAGDLIHYRDHYGITVMIHVTDMEGVSAGWSMDYHVICYSSIPSIRCCMKGALISYSVLVSIKGSLKDYYGTCSFTRGNDYLP